MKTDGQCSQDTLRKLIKYAVLAPSGHNSQPWRFRVTTGLIEISPDYNRVRPIVDPHNRELFISLGAATKNIEIAAESLGLKTTHIIEGEKILVNVLGNDKEPKTNSLVEAIKKRRTNRGEFWNRKVETAKLNKIQKICDDKILFISNQETKLKLADLVAKADLVWFKNKELMTELEEWLRDDVEMTKDGLSTGVLNLYKVATEIKYLFSGDNDEAKNNANRDRTLVMDAPLLAAVMTQKDKIEDWIESGRCYQELALVLTSLGLANSFLNRPLELTGFRKKLANVVGKDCQVQLLVRIGYPKKKAKSSPRRPVEEVID